MSTTVNYPDGTSLTTNAATVTQMNELFQNMTCAMLGINPPDYGRVRVDWPTQGQPFVPRPNQDVMFIACVLEPDFYSKVRDLQVTDNLIAPDTIVSQIWDIQVGWKVMWCAYGPNSLLNTRLVWSGLFQDYFNSQLEQNRLAPITDYNEPTRIPEERNGQWWERADFNADFYEHVTETVTVGRAISVEVKVYENTHGLVADTTITTPGE